MNFKLNFWTLLFGITGIVLLYNTFSNTEKDNCPCPTATNDKDKIADTTFHANNANYESRCLSSLQTLNGSLGIVNMNIQYFRLESHEIEELYFHYRLGNKPPVLVYPVVKGNTGVSDTLDYVFYVADSTRRGGTYFDFTAPCPTLCNE